MQTEHSLNATAQTPEQHAVACWAALERHVAPTQAGSRCGCYQHSIARHIVILKSCEVGEALAEEYEIASRRVREITSASEQLGLESGDMESTVEVVRT